MGNKVTKTTVETVQINTDDNDDIIWGNNKINDNVNNDRSQYLQKLHFESNYQKPEWNDFDKQHFIDGYEDVNADRFSVKSSDSNKSQQLNTEYNNVQEYNDESNDVVSDMKDQKFFNQLNGRRTPLVRQSNFNKESLPHLVRSVDGDNDNNREIDELDSCESGSKLTLNDMKSDTEEVIQELDKLICETDEKELLKNKNFRRRGQSWSNFDNNVNVELKTESSLSSFSRPTSNIGKQIVKPKSFTAPETRGQIDSAIEWLAKQHGLDLGSDLDYERQKTNDTSFNKNTLRMSSMEIPGTVSTSPTPVSNENELEVKYDDLDQQIISSIENDFIR